MIHLHISHVKYSGSALLLSEWRAGLSRKMLFLFFQVSIRAAQGHNSHFAILFRVTSKKMVCSFVKVGLCREEDAKLCKSSERYEILTMQW